MVRLGLIIMVFALAGCSALRDAFSAHAQVAGTAAGQTLTVDRLAQVVGHAQRIPIRPDVLTGIASVYLDYAVFAAELGRGRDLHDSALVLAAQWPVAAQLKWERYHSQLVATRGKLTPAQAARAVRPGVRQCRVDAPAGRDDGRGPHAVRLPHHSPAAALGGAGLLS